MIIIERAKDGYGAWSPDLPGCVAVGDTEDEATREMREAIQGHLEVMRANRAVFVRTCSSG